MSDPLQRYRWVGLVLLEQPTQAAYAGASKILTPLFVPLLPSPCPSLKVVQHSSLAKASDVALFQPAGLALHAGTTADVVHVVQLRPPEPDKQLLQPSHNGRHPPMFQAARRHAKQFRQRLQSDDQQ
jgi:hypothetical protein